jgi:hypothetical protein
MAIPILDSLDIAGKTLTADAFDASASWPPMR